MAKKKQAAKKTKERPPTVPTVAANLSEAQRRGDMSRVGLAKSSGTSVMTVSRTLSGEHDASVGKVMAMAESLGLVPNKSLTVHQWDQAGDLLGHIDQRLAWYLGDWVTARREKWEQGSLEEICEKYGLNYSTTSNAATVCRAFEFSRRRENLSHNHHAEVANRPDADELLDWCEETDPPRTTKELRAEKHRRSKQAARIPPPKGKYRVLYDDPPWQYGDERGGTKAPTPGQEKAFGRIRSRTKGSAPVIAKPKPPDAA